MHPWAGRGRDSEGVNGSRAWGGAWIWAGRAGRAGMGQRERVNKVPRVSKSLQCHYQRRGCSKGMAHGSWLMARGSWLVLALGKGKGKSKAKVVLDCPVAAAVCFSFSFSLFPLAPPAPAAPPSITPSSIARRPLYRCAPCSSDPAPTCVRGWTTVKGNPVPQSQKTRNSVHI